MDLVDGYNIPYDYDDQYFFTGLYLSYTFPMVLDFGQLLFNSHSFIREGEYGYENGRVQILGNQSVFSHKNGKTVDPKLDELVRGMLG